MKYLPNNTLAHYNAAPQTHIHDLSGIPVAVFAAATKAFKQNCGETSPMDDAVTFYTLNHCVAIIRKSFTLNEPLPAWAQTIMAEYTDVAMAQGERLLHYLFCITTREMRHLKSASCAYTFWQGLKNTHGYKAVDALKEISSNGDEEVAMAKYLNTPPDMPIGQYVQALSYGFHKAGGIGWGGSYGGKPWGDTTDALVAMINGDTSMEMLVDTGYTLAHNGGPIFDKTSVAMYHHYDSHLVTVLDIQRSGQMLDLMLESNTLHVKKTAQAEAAVALLKQYRPEEFKGYVDWKLVDELRPANDKANQPYKYSSVMQAQAQPIQTKPATVKAPAKAAAKAPLASTLVMHGKKVKVVGPWQVFPNQVITQYERTEQ